MLDTSVDPRDSAKTIQAFRDRLAALPAADLRRIDQEFTHELARAYSRELWGAAYLINSGCSDDCFDYFRAWLIMQGSTVFNAAVRDPDSLASYPYLQPPAELEEALSITRDAYRAAVGKEPDTVSARPSLGPAWDFDDQTEMRRRYPKLFEKLAGPG